MTEVYTIQQFAGDALEVVSSSSDQSLVIEQISPLRNALPQIRDGEAKKCCTLIPGPDLNHTGRSRYDVEQILEIPFLIQTRSPPDR